MYCLFLSLRKWTYLACKENMHLNLCIVMLYINCCTITYDTALWIEDNVVAEFNCIRCILVFSIHIQVLDSAGYSKQTTINYFHRSTINCSLFLKNTNAEDKTILQTWPCLAVKTHKLPAVKVWEMEMLVSDVFIGIVSCLLSKELQGTF